MNKLKTATLTQLAILVAVIILMAFTPLGYIRTLGLEITFVMIPVIIGAITIGPGAGAFLGFVFGLTSFIQCFGMSPFGATLFAINPIYCFIVCVVTRTLMGWLCGLIFKCFPEKNLAAYSISSLSGALLNTLFFMSALILLFGKTEFIMGFRGSMGVIEFVVAFVGINGLVEAVACFVIATAISRAVARYTKH